MKSKKLILIADDSYSITSILKKVFTLKGFDVVTVKDGEALMDAMDRMDVDILLLDISMPKLSGIDCAQKIRSMNDPKKAAIPIISITGNYGNYSIDEFKSVGIDMFMQKPLDYDQLVNLVNQYLKN
jgi:two-component system cell cycle response regulator DivK